MKITLSMLHAVTSGFDTLMMTDEEHDELMQSEEFVGLEHLEVVGDDDSTPEDVVYANELWKRIVKTMTEFDQEFHDRFDCR